MSIKRELLIQEVDLRLIVAEAWGAGTADGNAVYFRPKWHPEIMDETFVVYRDRYEDQSGYGDQGTVFSWIAREQGWTLDEVEHWLLNTWVLGGHADVKASAEAPRPSFEAEPFWWPTGVPDTWRTALSHLGKSYALVVELANMAFNMGKVDPLNFTLKELVTEAHEQGHNISQSTLTKALRELVILEVFFQKLTPNSERRGVKNDKKFFPAGANGRRPEGYCALTVDATRLRLIALAALRLHERLFAASGDDARLTQFDEDMLGAIGLRTEETTDVLRMLNRDLAPLYKRHRSQPPAKQRQSLAEQLNNYESTPFPANWVIRDSRTYRMAFLRAVVEASPGTRRSNRTLRILLGVVRNTVRTLTRAAGLENEAQFDELQLDPDLDIREQVGKYGRKIWGRPQAFIFPDTRGEVVSYYASGAHERASSFLEEGSPVWVRFQCASIQKIVADGPVPPKPKAKSAPQPSKVSVTSNKNKTTHPVGTGVSDEWVRQQLQLALTEMQWRDGDRFRNPHTGETVNVNAPALQLLELLLERPLS